MTNKHPNVVLVEEFWGLLDEGKIDEFYSHFASDMVWLGWSTDGVPVLWSKLDMIRETKLMAEKLDSSSTQFFDVEAIGDDLVIGKCRSKRSKGDRSVDTVFPMVLRIEEGKIQYGADVQAKAAEDFWREVSASHYAAEVEDAISAKRG